MPIVVLQIRKIDRLGQEIERAPVHRGSDIGHITVGRDDYGREFFIRFLQLMEKRQPVHARHVDVGNHHVHAVVCPQNLQCFDTVPSKQEFD